MEAIKNFLRAHGYIKDERGFFTAAHPSVVHDNQPAVEAEKFWSRLARDNPIAAAAATDSKDWYAKYPTLVDHEVEPDRAQVVLDAGCGYGRVAIPLLKTRSSLHLVGVDASTEMLQIFSRLLEGENQTHLRNQVVLLHSAINDLPFDDETFDCIYSCAVLLHNPYEEVPKILGEFYRLLKPYGKLILASSFPNLYNLEGLQNYVHLQMRASPNANGPVRVYSQKRVRALFSKWRETRIIPNGVVLIPRQFAHIAMPFGRTIRQINGWLERQDLPFMRKTSIFVKLFDVVARK